MNLLRKPRQPCSPSWTRWSWKFDEQCKKIARTHCGLLAVSLVLAQMRHVLDMESEEDDFSTMRRPGAGRVVRPQTPSRSHAGHKCF